jgi:AraC-like DNA-binding protein
MYTSPRSLHRSHPTGTPANPARKVGQQRYLPAVTIVASRRIDTLPERFVHLIGQPPIQYLRMQLACRLLAQDGAKVDSVAAAVGFESAAAFQPRVQEIGRPIPRRMATTIRIVSEKAPCFDVRAPTIRPGRRWWRTRRTMAGAANNRTPLTTRPGKHATSAFPSSPVCELIHMPRAGAALTATVRLRTSMGAQRRFR